MAAFLNFTQHNTTILHADFKYTHAHKHTYLSHRLLTALEPKLHAPQVISSLEEFDNLIKYGAGGDDSGFNR